VEGKSEYTSLTLGAEMPLKKSEYFNRGCGKPFQRLWDNQKIGACLVVHRTNGYQKLKKFKFSFVAAIKKGVIISPNGLPDIGHTGFNKKQED